MSARSRVWNVLALALASLFIGWPAWAADLPAPAAGAGVAPQWEYAVGPGDTLSVNVVGESAYTGSFEISPAGAITFPDQMVKEMQVAGRTITQLQAELKQRLGQYFLDPQVTVELKSFRVVVSGQVVTPGEYPIEPGALLMQVIQKAGVPTDRQALSSVYVRRGNGAVISVRLLDFLDRGVVSENPPLQPGDSIGVGQPPAGVGATVAGYEVLGAVKKPGRYLLQADEPTRAWDALQQAGQLSDDADARHAVLRRAQGANINLDLSRLEDNPAQPANVVLSTGDVLFVPRLTTRVSVMGAVAKPGEALVGEGTTLLEVLGKAGGLSGPARLTECAIIRLKPQPMRTNVNLESLLKKGEMTDNPVLQDGDIVWVPPAEGSARGPGRTTWDKFNEALRSLWILRWL
jgi:polysaccharide export outer membrane protein